MPEISEKRINKVSKLHIVLISFQLSRNKRLCLVVCIGNTIYILNQQMRCTFISLNTLRPCSRFPLEYARETTHHSA